MSRNRQITGFFTTENLPVFDGGFFGAGVDQRIKSAGMFCNLIEPVKVECLDGDHLPLQRVVTSQNVVIALKATGVGATLNESDREASNNDNADKTRINFHWSSPQHVSALS